MIDIRVNKTLQAARGEMTLMVDETLADGQLLGLFGKSGAGKTSLLRILAGLLSVAEGRIVVDGTTWLDTQKNICLSPQLRKVGLVFQDYALFPNMNVRENLSFALEKGQAKGIVDELIEISELGDLQHQRPRQLSGGQQQRVALARALVQRPRLLLLDEPLSALDLEMREKLQQHLFRIHREYQLTTIIISHDPTELCQLADQIWVINNGKIETKASPRTYFADKSSNEATQLRGVLIGLEPEGKAVRALVQLGSEQLSMLVTTEQAKAFVVGQTVSIAFGKEGR